MVTLIGFTGKAGHGKSTASKLAESELRMVRESFMKRPKEALKLMFGLTEEQVFGDKAQKEQTINHLSYKRTVNARMLLQTMCTEWARNTIDDDIWIYAVKERWDRLKNINGFAGMVVEDVRFDNDAEWIKSEGGIIIEVFNPEVPASGDGHMSERGISSHLIDYQLINPWGSENWGKEELLQRLRNLIAMHTATANTGDYSIGKIEDIPLQKLVVDWANEVFPDRTITNALTKLVMHEIPEYLVKQDDPLELADINILLLDIANLAGIDLEQATREKMAINRKRQWAIDDKTGLMSHVKEGSKPFVDLRSVSSMYNYPAFICEED